MNLLRQKMDEVLRSLLPVVALYYCLLPWLRQMVKPFWISDRRRTPAAWLGIFLLGVDQP